MSPSCQKEICKKRNPQYGGGESFSENDARHESDTSIQESDEPKHKKARYSVGTVKSNNSETFHPSIAEKIKLRERKYSQSYDESQGRSVAGKESSKKSPRHLTSCHPYMRRKDSSPGHSPGHSTSKIFIEKTFYTNNMSLNLSDKDKNHNELSDLDSSQAPVYPVQTTSSEVTSTTEVRSINQANCEPDSSQVRDREGPEEAVGASGPTKVSRASVEEGKTYSQVTLQPSTQTQTFWQLREKERNGAVLTDRNYKQICRSRKFNTRYPAPEKPRQKRAVIQDMVRPLKQWLLRHRHNPYPTKAEKLQLAVGSNMTLVQVSNWFANARRRLKNVVQESRCSWSKRLRLYNQCVQGNAELLSISSDDSIWNSDDEEEDRQSDSVAGNTDEFELDDGGVVVEHSYSRGQQAVSVTTSEGDQEECPAKSVSSLGEHISAAASPTDTSGTPPASPSPSPHNIPDTNKYKINMLRRYLNDAAEAAESFSKDRADAESSSQSDQEETTAEKDVTTETISNNITISFTNTNMVPVISQPPRDEMGVEKVKRQLADSYSLPPQHEFSSSDLGLAASEEVTTLPLSQPLPASTSAPAPPTIFSPLGHLSVLPLAPAHPYPFFQGPITSWTPGQIPFTPVPHFLHLIPNSNCPELGSASGGPAPPPAAAAAAGGGGGGGAGAWMPGSTAGPGPVPPPARGWVERVELDAAVALSQLAHSAQGHCPPAPPILVSSAAGAPGPALAATLLKPPPASPSCT